MLLVLPRLPPLQLPKGTLGGRRCPCRRFLLRQQPRGGTNPASHRQSWRQALAASSPPLP